MPTYTIIKLTNLTPLHIGTGKENYDFSASDLHSDTLSSALAAIRAQQGKNKDIEDFLASFSVSSAFPFYEKQYFFPKMQGKLKISIKDKNEQAYRKKMKNVKFVEFPLWQKLISGKPLDIEDGQIQDSFMLTTVKPFEHIFKAQVSERVWVPREDGKDATPFFFDWKFFHKSAGLFCLTDATGHLLDEIITLFSILGEVGLGTDRNIGGGKFEIEVEKDAITIESPHDANATMLLSLYIPTESEMENLNLQQSHYELILRGGYISGSQEESLRHLRKKSIYMFGVGSAFPCSIPLQGKIVDLKPAWNDSRMHPVYRSGKPFCIPVKYDEL
jgi:CRISPR type III-A-associated RAMP protein Csm4